MKEQLITSDTALLAKDKGFDFWTNETAYSDEAGFHYIGNGRYVQCTQSLLQKWLRDVHNIHVRVDNVNRPVKSKWYYELQFLPSGIRHLWTEDIDVQNSYEETLEIGLQESLKLIK